MANNIEKNSSVKCFISKRKTHKENDSMIENIAIVSHGEFIYRFINKYGEILKIENKEFFNNCEFRIGLL